MIELIPAIDIIGGKCVRLTQGDYGQSKEYGDPVEMAIRFEQAGYKRLHMVDLDGARNKHVVNSNILRAVTKATCLCVDFGGGIKSDDDLDKVFEAGAQMATVGSVAVTNPGLYSKWLEKYGASHIILGADVRNGHISINGWKEDSAMELNAFLKSYMDKGTKNVLCTDICRDGMLQGTATEMYRSLMTTYPYMHLIASGGVSSIHDIVELERAGVPAVVFGKAIYEGKIDIHGLLKQFPQDETSDRESLKEDAC
ncbi:MAG: 1-(5-phosphoribosyl)-5-[(5-phosphoribosylamino)methylideneamino]imidazole-4-carboxamide isomerase [Bacteroidaceae bacterium]